MHIFTIAGRLLVIMFAYMMAAICAGLFFAYTALPKEQYAAEQIEQLWGMSVEIASALLVGFMAAKAAIMPSVVLIAAAEIMGWRSLVSNLIGAGILAVFVIVMVYAFPEANGVYQEKWIQIAAATLVGGIVYWIIAGRNAGLWMPADTERLGRLDDRDDGDGSRN